MQETEQTLIGAPFEVQDNEITKEPIERQFSRTFTEIETEDLKKKRKVIQEMAQGSQETARVSAHSLGYDTPRKIMCFPVKHGVSGFNLLAIAVVPICVMLTTTYVNAQTIFLLEDKEMFNVPEKQIGRVASQLALWGYPFAMAGTFVSGYIYDIVGRRITLFLSFSIGAVLIFFIPYTAPNVFPGLFAIRILFQICMTAPACSPLVADYIHKDSIGKAASLVGVGYVVGEVLSMGVLFRVTADMSHKAAFLTVAIVGIAASVILLFLVKEPRLRSPEQKASACGGNALPSRISATSQEEVDGVTLSEDQFRQASLSTRIKVITAQLREACRKDKTFYLLFGASMMSNMYFTLFSTYWLLFITSFIGTKVQDEKQASNIYASVMIISVICGLMGMPLVGIFSDRVSPKITVPFAFLTRFVAMLLFMFVKDPTQFYSYLCSVLMIFGTANEQIVISSIIFRLADREIRGTINGMSQSCGYFGQLILSLCGGFLFDYISPYAPFAFVGVFDLLFATTAIVLGYFDILKNDHAIRKRAEYEAKEAIRHLEESEDQLERSINE